MTVPIPQYRRRAFAEGGGIAISPRPSITAGAESAKHKSLSGVIKGRRAKRARSNSWKGKRGADFTRDAIQRRYDSKQ